MSIDFRRSRHFRMYAAWYPLRSKDGLTFARASGAGRIRGSAGGAVVAAGATGRPQDATVEGLMAKGVSHDALCEPELPAQARVIFGVRTFDFADGDGGTSALVFLAYDAMRDPADLVAWCPAERRLASHWRAVSLLGAESLLAPRLTDKNALPVYRDPLGWLLGERFGVVPIERDGAAVELRDFGPFIAEDERHGLELQQVFRRTEPQIFVPKSDAVQRAA